MPASPQTVQIPTVAVHDITFNGSSRPAYTFSGTTTGQTLTINGNVTMGAGDTAMFNSGLAINLPSGTHTVDVGGPATQLTVNGNIGGAGAITKTGNGTLILTGNNSFAGDLYVSGGTVNVQSNTGTGLGALELGLPTGAKVNFSSAAPTIYGLKGTSTLDTIMLGNPTQLTINQSENTVFAGTITGAGIASSLTKAGSGILELSGLNTYTGTTRITGGTLSVSLLANGGTASGIGSSDNTYDSLHLNGGTLQYTGSGTSTDRNFAIGINGGTLDASGTGAIVFTNPATIANLFAPSGGARSLTLTGNNTGDNQLSGILGNSSNGTASLTKSGPGKWVLTGASTYTGGTTISSGALSVTSTGSIGTGGLDLNGGSLALNNTAGQTVSYLSGGGGLSLASGVTLTDNQSDNSIFSGGISGGGHLTKNNTGGLTLSGSSSYTGGTTINGGTIVLTNNSALGSTSAAVTVNSGGTLALNGVSTNLSPVLNSGSRLIGNGNLNTAIIGAGVTLSPGLGTNPIGTLTFNDLTLGPDSILEINVRYNGESTFDFDMVNVNFVETLTIAANAAHPLTLKLISLNGAYLPGTLQSVSLGNTYTLFSLIQTQGISGSLTLGSNLLIDSTNFDPGSAGATFSFDQSGNNFNLSFTPVPEPSTYALMALGLGFIGLTVWRKSRRLVRHSS